MFFSRRFSADWTAILLIMTGLVGVIAFSQVTQNPGERATGSMYNSGETGVQALWQWLARVGYRVRTAEPATFTLSPDDSVLFVLAPLSDFDQLEMAQLDGWVQTGGTLVLAYETKQAQDLPDYYNLSLQRVWLPAGQMGLSLPTLNWPMVGQVDARARQRWVLDCQKAAVHLGDCDTPILASFGRGKGQVFALSTVYLFTNEGLTNRNNAQLIQNLVLATAVPGSGIVFDEAHRQSPFWLFSSREGAALWFCVAAAIVYMLANNRPFGSVAPLSRPVASDTLESGEFITSMAESSRRRGINIRTHYWQRLKRRLARRYQLDPALNDELFLAELIPYAHEDQVGTLIYLLNTKDRQRISEIELQQWVSVAIQAENNTNYT